MRLRRRKEEPTPGKVPFVDDDGGSVVIGVEAEPPYPGGHPQALWVRVGPVFDNGIQRREPGVWIEYQPSYLNSDVTGPILLDADTWRLLNRAVKKRLKRWRG